MNQNHSQRLGLLQFGFGAPSTFSNSLLEGPVKDGRN